MEIAPGTTIGPFRVERRLGAGGMGAVFLAQDTALDRAVALKVVAPERAGEERFRRRFLQESKLAARLDHPAIVPVYFAGESEGRLFLAMRHVNGASLAELLDRTGPLPAAAAIALLAPIADALDTAHAAGLVHRDVKPGNILVEPAAIDGRPYLCDFGLARHATAADNLSREDGLGVSGTMGYLAPEQIEGDAVDGRTDQYALACVLFECLAGRPPFERADGLAVVYAHLTEPPPSLSAVRRELPATINAVIARGLAKTPQDRYGSCRALIDDAAAALSVAPVARRDPVPRAPNRRRFALAAAGAVVVVVAVSVALLTRGDRNAVGTTSTPPATATSPGAPATPATSMLGSAIRVDPEVGRVTTAFPAGGTPDGIAVGGGSVWVVNADSQTLDEIDPATGDRQTRGGFGRVMAITAGQDAVWLAGDDAGQPAAWRIDFATGQTRAFRLPRGTTFADSPDAIAVAASAIWIATGTGAVVRLDPTTGASTRLDGAVEARAFAVSAGSVWAVGRGRLWRIDPLTNDVTESITADPGITQAAVDSADNLWALNPGDGVIWHITTGQVPKFRTVDGGRFGRMALTTHTAASNYHERVWITEPATRTLLAIDLETGEVAHRVDLQATPQSLAANDTAVWIGGTGVGEGSSGTVVSPACTKVQSAPGMTPQVVLVSDVPLQRWESRDQEREVLEFPAAIRQVLADRGFRAGRFAVGYQSCDSSTPMKPEDPTRCIVNARAYAAARLVVGVIGPYFDACTRRELPILNGAAGGPIAVVGTSATADDLTYSLDGDQSATAQDYYPTGKRNYARVVGADASTPAANVELARELGARRVFIAFGSSAYGRSTAQLFEAAVEGAGLVVADTAMWDATPASQTRVAARAAASRPDAVFLLDDLGSGDPGDVGAIGLIRDRLPRVPVIATSRFFPVSTALEHLGRAAVGVYATVPGAPNASLPSAGRDFLRRFAVAQGRTAASFGAAYAGQATNALLDAISRSDGSRASVTEQLMGLRVVNGLIGPVAFTADGDVDPATFSVFRITGTRRSAIGASFAGADFVRTVTVTPPPQEAP